MKPWIIGVWAGVAALLLSAGARAEEWTIDDIVGGESASGLAMSPDGRWGVWEQSSLLTLEGVEQEVWALHLADMHAATSRVLTRGASSAWSARFSPDSTSIAFLSDRGHPTDEDAADTQVWILPVDGGEARCVTAFTRGIIQFEWCGADALLVLAQDGKTRREAMLEDAKDAAIIVELPEDEPRTRLFRVEIESGEVRRVSENSGWIESFTVSPTGDRAIFIENTSLSAEFDEKVKPRIVLVDLTTGAMTPLMADLQRAYYAVNWDPDDRGFYFEYLHSTHPMYRVAGVMHLAFYDFATGGSEVINRGLDHGYIRDIDPHANGVTLIFEQGTTTRLARIERTSDGWRSTASPALTRGMFHEIARPLDGEVMLTRTSSSIEPETISRLTLGPAFESPRLEPIAELNPAWRERDTGRVEVITWRGARGERIEGVLHYPLEYEPGEKHPLIIAAHGGPLAASQDEWASRWAYPFLLWRQRGAFVLEPNYHGSSGYGIEFAESIGDGHYLSIDVEDCEKGVDHVIAMGLADPDRLGIAGWSNGAILGAMMLVRSDRWKAASLGAGDVEFISDWGNVDFGAAFSNYYFRGPPWEQLELIERSAYFRVERITTPTIILTGTEDRSVPPSQSWSLFRALQQIGKAPTRLVLFPGEPHTLQKIAHQRRKIEEELAWFDRYLFDRAETPNEALDDASPLAALIARARASRSGGSYGVDLQGVLVPEFVESGGIRVTRFEITNAQWRAFDPAHSFPADQADLPVTGVSFERAGAYAAWLAGVLGEPARLPALDEAESLRAEHGAWSGGNTLDHWAGYSVTPDDRQRLMPALAGLPAGALLMRVGSMTGSGEGDAMLFDLDGNAAEWAAGEDGSGIVVGPSADRPADARDKRPTPDPAYIGVRLVIGG